MAAINRSVPSGASLAAFTAKLLAPLPEDVEPVNAKSFLKDVERDMQMDWRARFEPVELAIALHQVAAIKARKPGNGDVPLLGNFTAYAKRIEAERTMMFVPAPTMKELRWKRKRAFHWQDDGDVAAAIARDEARLAAGGR